MQYLMITKVRFERAERGNQDAGGGFLADPPAAPALPLGPFLERALPAQHMPQTRPGWRGDAQMRQIERAQRIELRHREARPEILAGLAHAGANRAAPLHDRERVDRAI